VPDDGTYDISATNTSLNGGDSAIWSVSDPAAAVTDSKALHGSGPFSSLASDETTQSWSVTVRVSFIPRQTDTYADGVTISRHDNGDGTWDVTTTGNPVQMGVNDDCDTSAWPWNCPREAGANVTTLQGEFRDFNNWDDASQRGDFMGMDSWTNVEASDVPPQIISDPFTIKIDLANSHFLKDESAPFQGFYHQVIPNKFLIDMGIDDPATLSPAGVSAEIGSGTSVVTPGADSTAVDTTGITFSPRVLKLAAGVITPTRPKSLRTNRTAAHRATLRFHHAKPRGSRLIGYQARCQAKHHTTVTAKGKHAKLRLHGLARGTAYQCQVRAKSKAGYGHWSAKKKLTKS
jgi:hypothetical protein